MSEEKQQAPGPQANPLLIEVGLTLSRLATVLVAVATTGLSLASGATLWDATLRGAAAALALGLLSWMLNWMVVRGALEALAAALQEAVGGGSRNEWQA